MGCKLYTPRGAVRTPHAREYHLIDLIGISHGGFVSLAGARQFARQEGLSAWDIFSGNLPHLSRVIMTEPTGSV